MQANLSIQLDTGHSIVFLGANGSGKTRLAVHLERQVQAPALAHRIAAHRSLTLNTKVQPPSVEIAERQLFYGHDTDFRSREIYRWGRDPTVHLLNDFERLVAALYADENDTAVKFKQAHLLDPRTANPTSKLDRLRGAWGRLLPGRDLVICSNNIKVQPDAEGSVQYDAGGLSDGERVIFYLLGQCLVCPPNSLLIIDEPELHLNRSIIAKIWDEAEALRPDFAFIYLTHDLEFASSRRASRTFAVEACLFPAGFAGRGAPDCVWRIREVPKDTDIPEEVISRIVGSRHPILFVEGELGSLDASLFRWTYPEYTIVPVGSCDRVIHSVVTFESHGDLHRFRATGLIDNDHRNQAQIDWLKERRIEVVTVMEAENLPLLKEVFFEVGKILNFDDGQIAERWTALCERVLAAADADKEAVSIRAAKRALDSMMKRTSSKAKNINDLTKDISNFWDFVNPSEAYKLNLSEMENAIAARDVVALWKVYDNKGLVSMMADCLGIGTRENLQDYVGRALRAEHGAKLAAVVRDSLPAMPAYEKG